MNEYVEILDDTICEIEKDPSKFRSFKGTETPIVFRGWRYCLDLKKTKTSFGNELEIIETINAYENGGKTTLFKMEFVLPLPNSYSNWVVECLKILKNDSLEMEKLKANQLGFGKWLFAFHENQIIVQRNAEKSYGRFEIDWFEKRIYQGKLSYGGFSLREGIRDFFLKNFSNEKSFFLLPDELRDLIINE